MPKLKPIARMRSDFPDKFGIPRQSGLVDALQATVIFEPDYRTPQALRGLEDFSHIWLIWGFSATQRETWSPTVRPPKLGGNIRMGVFATRSPFRPNALGLSSVKVERIELQSPQGPLIRVRGADLMDGTPIYDIKPYLPFTDSHPEATGGFTDRLEESPLEVQIDNRWSALLSTEEAAVLRELLAGDPRPSYQTDSERVYGMPYRDFEVRFSVCGSRVIVQEIERIPKESQ